MSAKNSVPVSCAYCGQGKQVPLSRTKDRKLFFCNNECKSKYQVKNGTIVLVCSICGDYYKVPRYFATIENTRKSKYCSKQCHSEAFKIKRQGEGNPLWVDKIKKICPVCKKEFWVAPSNKFICCSDKCGHKRRSSIYRRENHWNWTGGNRHDYGPEWKAIARGIRKRDNWTCQVCGIYSKGRNGPVGVLHVHHIKPLLSFKGDYNEANKESNLVSLCKHCHRSVEVGNQTVSPVADRK